MGFDYPEQRRGNGCWSVLGNFLLMVTGGVILLALVGMFGVWWAGDRFFEGLDTVLNPPVPTPEVDVRSVVLQQVRGASELTTTEYIAEAIIPARQVGTLLGFEVTETRLLYIAVGEVRAGVDLSEIEREDIEVVSDTLRLTLPPPRLLGSQVDVNRSYVYDLDRGFLNLGPEAEDLQTQAEREGLRQIVLKACEFGILEEANEEAQVVVAELMSIAGFSEVIVETQPPAVDECPVE
ncbi:MAG: DUF4230 domain-containing protein [Chloroflexota bacterium]|nr:DUF4230 domain-containing protein [Chloroflexota bacterium]